MKRIAPLAIAVVLVACGSSSVSSTATANVVTGAASCAAQQQQDLTFSGYLTGHLICSTMPAACVNRAAQGGIGLYAPVNARVGQTTIQIEIVFRLDLVVAGSYTAGSVGDAQTSSPTGVTLDGIGHWQTQAGAGTMSIDELSAAGAAGKVDARLVKGTDSLTLRGTWRCVGAPA